MTEKSGDALLGDDAAETKHPLTTVRGVNETDAETLTYNFGSFQKIAEANAERLREVPGLCDTKVERFHTALKTVFCCAENR